jgi:isocitrate/isopropylmalate dehydrogenase
LLGQGTSGNVFLVEKKENKEVLAVKKINMISITNGINKRVVTELRKEIEVMRKL